MKGNYFCLVVSPQAFNARFKLAMVCPVSGGAAEAARSAGFLVSLMGQGLRTDGQVHAHQIKSLAWASRRATLVERAPGVAVQEVLMCLRSVLDGQDEILNRSQRVFEHFYRRQIDAQSVH